MRLGVETDIEVVGEAPDGRVSDLVALLLPDVVLMDVAMPEVDGIEAASALGAAYPGVAVVMLSLYDDAETRGRAAASGAAGFVAKHEPEGTLVEVIRRAVRQRPSSEEARRTTESATGPDAHPEPGQTPGLPTTKEPYPSSIRTDKLDP